MLSLAELGIGFRFYFFFFFCYLLWMALILLHVFLFVERDGIKSFKDCTEYGKGFGVSFISKFKKEDKLSGYSKAAS